MFLCVFPLYNLFKYLIWWFISVHEGKTKCFRYLKWLQLYNMITGPFNDIKAHYTSPFLILQLQICQKAHDWNWSFQQRYERTTTREGFCHRGLRSDCPLNIFCIPQFCTSSIDSGVSFAYIVSGYISYNFVIGAYSYWGPKAGQQIYNMVKSCLLLTRGNVLACIWRYILVVVILRCVTIGHFLFQKVCSSSMKCSLNPV